jgi:hypothetical protein
VVDFIAALWVVGITPAVALEQTAEAMPIVLQIFVRVAIA